MSTCRIPTRLGAALTTSAHITAPRKAYGSTVGRVQIFENMKTNQWMKTLACLLITLAVLWLTGCVPNPHVKLKAGSASGPRDIGTPATVESGGTVTTLALPAGSTVESTPGTPATGTAPASPPAVKVTLAAPSELRTETHAEKASTGTLDTRVATHRIDKEAEEKARRPLLYAAIAALVAAVVAVAMKWPALATLCGIASGCFFAAWKLAEVPWWAGLLALVAGGALWLGYKRGEADANGNGIPDRLEGKR